MNPTERMREWRAANRDHYLAYEREYKKRRRQADPDRARANDRERYARDAEKIKARAAAWRAERVAAVAALKAKPCADCGQQFHQAAMEFDHLPERGDKRFNIGRGSHRYSMAEVMDEIAKCEVVCANCHAIRTYERGHR